MSFGTQASNNEQLTETQQRAMLGTFIRHLLAQNWTWEQIATHYGITQAQAFELVTGGK